MKHVGQTIINKDSGDCNRACIASLLELPIEAVPHFSCFGSRWMNVLKSFLLSLEYDYDGTGYPIGPDRPYGHVLSESPNIDGFVMASVPSRTFENISHAVVMDLNGVIVHDPNPNKKWNDMNIHYSLKIKRVLLFSHLNSIPQLCFLI